GPLYRLARNVHVFLGLEHHDVLGLRDLTSEFFAPTRRIPAPGQLVCHHEADVVTRVLVLATRISKPYDEPHERLLLAAFLGRSRCCSPRPPARGPPRRRRRGPRRPRPEPPHPRPQPPRPPPEPLPSPPWAPSPRRSSSRRPPADARPRRA